MQLDKIKDIEDFARQNAQTFQFKVFDRSEETISKLRDHIHFLLSLINDNKNNTFNNFSHESLRPSYKKLKFVPSKAALNEVYINMTETEDLPRSEILENYLMSSICRGISGVSVVAVFLSPYPNGQPFSCQWDCDFCPLEPGQPRSYLFSEPGVLRANQNKFDCVEQMYSRIHSLRVCGHPADKFEILILGGTIYSYPKDYLEEFMRDIFYAANTCFEHHSRDRKTLREEQDINEFETDHRIIGITVETRPDCIKPSELVDFRRWGVTRVQIGVQHTDDEILKKANRGHGLKQTLKACQLLRDCCFKFDVHLMPNLKGSSPEKDIEMMDYVLQYIHPDQVKLYPTTTTPFTKILEDYKNGSYVPYGNEDLERVVLYWLTNVHPWIRNNRIVRDIPNEYIIAGVKTSNQKQEFDEIMKKRGITCMCIRSREPGRVHNDPRKGELVIRSYEAQGGTEHFISWESKPNEMNQIRETIFGFVRLRISLHTCTDIFPELEDCALIRELHVYGNTIKVDNENNQPSVSSQHLGIGKALMMKAKELAKDAGFTKLCVIAGIGTRNYYRKLGFELVNTFMIEG